MQFKYLLLALTAQTAIAATLETFTLNDGTTIEADPDTILAAHSPDDKELTRGVGSSAAGAKMLLARSCYPDYPVGCQDGAICCQADDLCCENRSCIDPDVHNCCLYGYYCDKPYQCVQYSNGNIGCQL
ncbi:uncharacterized protein BJX67DRAFT_348865 [Aspergillus lucknowensis]|uniref:Granulins domain-containing protein n=1 Tax=Aspergillus lucknowensis TaxID=176173 RepID=A0ABR4LXD2_9EURO